MHFPRCMDSSMMQHRDWEGGRKTTMEVYAAQRLGGRGGTMQVCAAIL